MKVIEYLEKSGKPLFSFEILPPNRGGNIDSLIQVIEELVQYKPPFIDVTSHAAHLVSINGETKKKRKRPGTLGICALIQKKYNIDAVPHVLCEGFTREETEDFVIDLSYVGVHNVLALRGDDIKYTKEVPIGRSVNKYASELVRQLTSMKRGIFLDDIIEAQPIDLCIGVAGYPEKHFAAPDIDTDINYLKAKVNAGASYVVTQMFFNNEDYFAFVDKCRSQGITVPIIPGLKVITTKKQLETLPEIFNIVIPQELQDKIRKASKKKITEIGASWTSKQVEGLLRKGVPSIHFYVMQSPTPIHKVMRNLNGISQ